MMFAQNQPLPFKGLWPCGLHLGAQQPNCILGNTTVLRDEQAARARGPPPLHLGERSVEAAISGPCPGSRTRMGPERDCASTPLSSQRGPTLREKRNQPWLIIVKVTMFHRWPQHDSLLGLLWRGPPPRPIDDILGSWLIRQDHGIAMLWLRGLRGLCGFQDQAPSCRAQQLKLYFPSSVLHLPSVTLRKFPMHACIHPSIISLFFPLLFPSLCPSLYPSSISWASAMCLTLQWVLKVHGWGKQLCCQGSQG